MIVGKKQDKRRLVVERAKFAKHVMVPAGMCYGGKGRLHFIPDNNNNDRLTAFDPEQPG